MPSAGFYCLVNVSTPAPSGYGNFTDGSEICPTANGGECPVGHYCPGGTGEPKPCDGGHYCPEAGKFFGLCTADLMHLMNKSGHNDSSRIVGVDFSSREVTHPTKSYIIDNNYQFYALYPTWSPWKLNWSYYSIQNIVIESYTCYWRWHFGEVVIDLQHCRNAILVQEQWSGHGRRNTKLS